MMRMLDVWWDGRLVGHLSQDQHGDLGFVYAEAWLHDAAAPPLSASLPKRDEPFTRREARSYFAGLLPEEDQREAAAEALGVSAANDFALLDQLGGDVAGAIELFASGTIPPKQIAAGSPTPLSDAALREVLAILPERPLLAGQGLRLSLAGAQSKVPVVLVGGAVALPAGAQPTTHIVKPPIKRFPATTENEAFVMRLAATIGLDVAAVEPRVLGSQTFLLVERYDRRIDANGHVRRLHQEDFCQALGFPPERKYASEGGPTIKDCFSLLRRVSVRPAADVLRLLDAVIFNVVVGNADAHGKNFSLLYDSDGPQLAPLYDLLSTVFYPRLSAVFAMKIGCRSTLGDLDAKGWARFAEDAGISRQLLRRRVLTICQQVRSRAADVAASINAVGFDQVALTSLAETTATRGAACETSLDR